MLEQIYPIFILIGATIGTVLACLWWQARAASQLNLALIRLNEQLQFDAPAFLQNAWPLLAQSGLHGISWKLDWFGVMTEGRAGKEDGVNIHKEIKVGEMKLAIRFRQSRHSERRYFNEALIETFLLLLRTDMWIKAGTIDATFSQMSKLTLFLQHDMKNVAQFIQLMSDQLLNVPAGKEMQVLDYLRVAAPLIRQRADHIVRTLTLGQLHVTPVRNMQLREELIQICKLYRLECMITGNAQITVPENTLDSALDNVLKNYSDLSLRDAGVKPFVSINVHDNARDVEISISAANTAPMAHMERLFEPFWSSDQAGLGIGLYQSRQMLEMCQGTIKVTPTETGQLQFLIQVRK
jgi:signal transduction histidine kinase